MCTRAWKRSRLSHLSSRGFVASAADDLSAREEHPGVCGVRNPVNPTWHKRNARGLAAQQVVVEDKHSRILGDTSARDAQHRHQLPFRIPALNSHPHARARARTFSDCHVLHYSRGGSPQQSAVELLLAERRNARN